MHLAYTDEQEALRAELRDYYDRILDPDTRQAIHDEPTGPVMRSVVKQMAADGWLGIGWPVEYGGQGKGPMGEVIFFDEWMRGGGPGPRLSNKTGGPAIKQVGPQGKKDIF